MAKRPGGARGSTGKLEVGAFLTGMITSQAKRGVVVEVGSRELLLPRSRFGPAVDRIEACGYGDPLTVEVVADPGLKDGVGLTRLGIERSIRQPRAIEGTIDRDGRGFALRPADGSASFPVVLLDRFEVDHLLGAEATWLVGAPHRDRRFVLADDR